jgi:hypothetical protein
LLGGLAADSGTLRPELNDRENRFKSFPFLHFLIKLRRITLSYR